MELKSAERLEDRARDNLAHAMDRMLLAETPRAKARHRRRAAMAAERLALARWYVRDLSAPEGADRGA